MSIIHVNQIKTHITKLFENAIDLADVSGDANQRLNFFLTRALAAYVVYYNAQIDVALAASAVTDGSQDNGIDAIYYDQPKKQLYIVQSKWIHDGQGQPDNGEVKKFISGVKDLFNLKFERFNSKVNGKRDDVIKALNDPYTNYALLLAYTGISVLSEPSNRDLGDLASEINDASEVLTITVLNQPKLHASLTMSVSGEPVNLDIGIKSWGRVQEPYVAYYGQINALSVGEWWTKYRSKLFAKNLRGVLGDSDVNSEMRETLTHHPDRFWYFNNGITIVTKRVTKTMMGGGDTDFGTFHCEDANVVNGAQTVSTIGKFAELSADKISKVFVPIRVISLENSDAGFGEEVTKTNNRQNRIENRDFVTLDREQNRIKMELAIDGIDYNIMRGEAFTRSENAFDLVESTTALACASGKVNLVVQLKREIGKLWDDIGKPPYKELFNGSIVGLHVWRCVLVQRKIDAALETIVKNAGASGRDYGIAVHGNRLIASMIFDDLDAARFSDPSFDFDAEVNESLIVERAGHYFNALRDAVEQEYSNAIIPTLFKNLTKCKRLVELCH